MTKPPAKNLPASIQARLANEARNSGRPYNEVLQYYAIERFLYRLYQSRYADHFVLKGALLFRVWGLPSFRPTRDIDLLGFTSNDVADLVAIMREVCREQMDEDGIRFDPDSVTGERIKEEAEYEGVRIRIMGLLGKARLHIQIDVAFADVVTPGPTIRDYPAILDMPAPQLRSYPPEAVVAEKLQAMIYLGGLNSRMKDFYDLWTFSQRFQFEGKILQEAVRRTFENRTTEIPISEPVAYSAQFARERQKQWEAFLETATIADAPRSMEEVQTVLRDFILPIFAAIRENTEFGRTWKPGGLWF